VLRLGLMGAGAIGEDVIKMVQGEFADRITIPAVLVRNPRDHQPDNQPLITNSFDEFFKHEFDVVLEGAGHAAVIDHAETILRAKIDMIVTSVGAFTDDSVYQRCIDAARTAGSRLIIPSAGIGALDTLSAAAVGGLTSVHMIVRKDPSAWYGTHAEGIFDLPGMTEPTVIFEGSPREGAALYPQNVNISAAVSLAGMGLDDTRLTIIADTDIDTHVCEIHAEGAFGKFSFVENLAVAESNRKTAKIVAMAVMKTVRQMVSPVIIGA
jgi:aspartate dehydrogenase